MKVNRLDPFRFERTKREGGALVAALMVVATVGTLSAMSFQLNQATWRRQLTENDKKRAFYLAEAGLSESMAAITMGLGGNVATEAEPAAFGEGYLFVEAKEDLWGFLHLDSYGICGDARHHLSLVVDKRWVPLAKEGFFGEDFVIVGSEATIDAEPDPASGGAADGGALSTEDAKVTKTTTTTTLSMVTSTTTTKTVSMEEENLESDLGEQWKTAWLGGGEFQLNAWDAPDGSGRKYTPLVPFEPGDERPLQPATSTAIVGSNGAITITPGSSTDTMLDASVHPGPGQTVTPGVGVTITGSTTPREVAVPLPTLLAPTLDAGSDVFVAAGGTGSLTQPYTSCAMIRVNGAGTLTIVGPGQLVCDNLILATGANLIVDSSNGPVEIHVNDTITMATGATITSPTSDATGLLLYAHGVDSTPGTTEKVNIQGSGTLHALLYAPDAHVAVPASLAVVGSIVAKSLDVAAGASLSFEPALLNESYSALRVDPISWKVDAVPDDVKPNVYDPDADYKAAGTTPPQSSDSWQETEQVLKYVADDGEEYVYRGTDVGSSPAFAVTVVDNLVSTDTDFDDHEEPSGRIMQPTLP